MSKPTPPIPAPAPVRAPVTPQRVAPVASPRTTLDAPPANVATARAKADSTRRSFLAALTALRGAIAAQEAATAFIASDKEAAVIFAHESLSGETLEQFGKLARPLLAAFTPRVMTLLALSLILA